MVGLPKRRDPEPTRIQFYPQGRRLHSIPKLHEQGRTASSVYQDQTRKGKIENWPWAATLFVCMWLLLTLPSPKIDIGTIYNYSCKHRLSPDFKEEQREVEKRRRIHMRSTSIFSSFSILIFPITTMCEPAARKRESARNVGPWCRFASRSWSKRWRKPLAMTNYSSVRSFFPVHYFGNECIDTCAPGWFTTPTSVCRQTGHWHRKSRKIAAAFFFLFRQLMRMYSVFGAKRNPLLGVWRGSTKAKRAGAVCTGSLLPGHGATDWHFSQTPHTHPKLAQDHRRILGCLSRISR